MAASSEGQIDSSRLLIPGLAGFYQAVAPYSYAMIRFITGAILVLHGYNKLFVFGVQGVADHVVTVLGLPMPLA
jgi:putative oxidoreductase